MTRYSRHPVSPYPIRGVKRIEPTPSCADGLLEINSCNKSEFSRRGCADGD